MMSWLNETVNLVNVDSSFISTVLSNSYSPAVDIGQIEGSVVMGIGWQTSEEIKYDKDSGRCYTNNTWVSVYVWCDVP